MIFDEKKFDSFICELAETRNISWSEASRIRENLKTGNLSFLAEEPVNVEYNRKVKVLQFLADWYEEHKHDILSAKYRNLDTDEDERVREWYGKCEGRHPNSRANAQEVIAKMDLNGYEVEEEPKFEVVLFDNKTDRLLLMELNEHDCHVDWECNNDGYRSQWFTEKQIKEFDERFWPFAVPFEEVNHE